MKHSWIFFLGLITMATPFNAQAARKANCELRLISEASTGEAYLRIFTDSKAKCMAKGDATVEARYLPELGSKARKLHRGPRP